MDKLTAVDEDDNTIGSYCYSYGEKRYRSRFALGDRIKMKEGDEIFIITSIYNSVPEGNFYYHICNEERKDIPGRFREKNWDGTEGPASEWTLVKD